MKLNRILLMLILSMLVSTTGLAASKDIKVIVDGVELYTDVPPRIINDRTLVPMRAIFEAIGAEVSWNEKTKVVTGTKDYDTVTLQIGSTKATVNGQQLILDSPPVIINDRTLVPVRFISESLGADVDWDEVTRTVFITTFNDTDPDNGYFKYTWENGEKYMGYWVNGVRQGYGTNVWPYGEIYTGDWMNDVRQGYGTNVWPDGEMYEGEFMNDVRHGYGINTWADGRVHEGYWLNDQMVD